MIKFAIRDDDVSFWTNPKELEHLYKEIWTKGVCVSFSIIPFAVRSFNSGDWNKFYQGQEIRPIHQNKNLVQFLKDKILEKKISILLHGYSHQYKVGYHNRKQLKFATKKNLEILKKEKEGEDLFWVGEYRWKRYEQLKRETKEAKEYLEDLFHIKISVFVPPSNDISSEGVKAVSECGLNISGTMSIGRFNRPMSGYSIKNWVLKLWWRLKYNMVYPYVMSYGNHKELCTYGLIPRVRLEKLKEQFYFCLEKNAPFVLSTHYWEVNKHHLLYKIYRDFIDFTYNKKVIYTSLDKIF